MKQFKIPKDIGEKWLKALRSGEFKQGKETLYNKKKDSYCCLGVLAICEGTSKEALTNYDLLSHTDSNIGNFLCQQKYEHKIGGFILSIEDILARLNDGEKYTKEILESFNLEGRMESTFEEIADFIEDNFEFTNEVL